MATTDSYDTARTALAAGILVAIAPHRRWHAGDFDGWLRPGRAARTISDGQVFQAGTWGGQWYPDFAPREGDIMASEHWGSADSPAPTSTCTCASTASSASSWPA